MAKPRRGRKRQPTAKRHQTTRAGQGRRENAMLPELQMRKAIALGLTLASDIRQRKIIGTEADVDINDPLSVLAVRGFVRLAGYDSADLIREADIFRSLANTHMGSPDAKAAHMTGLIGQGSVQVTPNFDPERDQTSFEAYIYRRDAVRRRIGSVAYWQHFFPLVVSRAFPPEFPSLLDGLTPPGFVVAMEGVAAMVDLRMGRKR